MSGIDSSQSKKTSAADYLKKVKVSFFTSFLDFTLEFSNI